MIMREAEVPQLETGGTRWSVLAGRYDPAIRPVTQASLEEVARETRRQYPNYAQTALERMVQIDTLLYAVDLCGPEIVADEATQQQAYIVFGRAAMLLSRYGVSDLQTTLNAELDVLGSPNIPVLEVIDDMLAQDLVGKYQSSELKAIVCAAAVVEMGGNLPTAVKPR